MYSFGVIFIPCLALLVLAIAGITVTATVELALWSPSKTQMQNAESSVQVIMHQRADAIPDREKRKG